jgi:hypothetical protein
MTSYEAFEKECLTLFDEIRCRNCDGTNIRSMVEISTTEGYTDYTDLIPWCKDCDGRAD